MQEEISGERIRLQRPACNLATAKVVYAVIDKCRDVFLPWLGWVKNTLSPQDTLAFLEKADADWKEKNQFVYGIYLDGKFIGLISALNVAWQHKRAEIGYWLDTDYTRQGYMHEAIELIEKELFKNGFHRLVIHTDVLNLRSAQAAMKAGYQLEGVLRQNVYSEALGRYRDQKVFAKLN